MKAPAFTLDLYSFLSFHKNPNEEIYNYLSATDIPKLEHCLNRLEKLRAYSPPKGNRKAQGKKSRLLGLMLEKISRIFLNGCNCLSHNGNVRTTTSEIDFLIGVEPTGLLVPFLADAGTHIIGEAKCYSSGPKTEWVNELAGLLPNHQAKIAFLFTACPPKQLRSEFRVAVAMHAARGVTIVPFGLTQMRQVKNGQNFLRVLVDQAIAAKSHLTTLMV